MHPFGHTPAHVLLGVTGGIASYKSAWLARLLTKAGAEVDVVMTPAATEFVGAITFEALTGRPVHTGLFDAGRALDHIKLARAATAIVVAPATADFLARAADGPGRRSAVRVPARGDLSRAARAGDERSHVGAPADAAQRRAPARARLSDRRSGRRHAGRGRRERARDACRNLKTIFAHVGRLLERDAGLRGKRVLVTAGPTREAIDPVRFISNHSSGKMGVALAAAAWRRGANVDLVAGPLSVAPPPGVTRSIGGVDRGHGRGRRAAACRRRTCS